MAQPMTALLSPEPDDHRTMPPCPDFCDGTCAQWKQPGGEAHHTSGFDVITLDDSGTDWYVSTSRTDQDYRAGAPDINVQPSAGGSGARLSPVEARRFAAMLLNAADLADPLPYGEVFTSPEMLHLGDELLTDDGWQRVEGLMFFTEPAQITVFTGERDENSDGWQLDAEDLVRIRRRTVGSCAIQFVEPIR